MDILGPNSYQSAGLVFPPPPGGAHSGFVMITVAERKSRFGAITIFKTKKTGSLIYAQGDSFQSEADANGVSLVAYIHAMFGLLRQAGSKTVLMIGCGGGTLATMLATVQCKLTVVDIDPHAFLLARRYFRFPADIDCRVADGCEFLLSEGGTFDAVVLDAYMAGDHPGAPQVLGVLSRWSAAAKALGQRVRQCPRRERSRRCIRPDGR